MASRIQTDSRSSGQTSFLSNPISSWVNPFLPLPHPAILCAPCLLENQSCSDDTLLSTSDVDITCDRPSMTSKARYSTRIVTQQGQSSIPYAINDMLETKEPPDSVKDRSTYLRSSVTPIDSEHPKQDIEMSYLKSQARNQNTTFPLVSKAEAKDQKFPNYAPNREPVLSKKIATRESTSFLRAWLQQHHLNPYPTKGEKIMLALVTRMNLTQISTWFANARRRLKKENQMTWYPRMRHHTAGNRDGLTSREKSYIGIKGVRDDRPLKKSMTNDFHQKQSEYASMDYTAGLFNTQLFSHLLSNQNGILDQRHFMLPIDGTQWVNHAGDASGSSKIFSSSKVKSQIRRLPEREDNIAWSDCPEVEPVSKKSDLKHIQHDPVGVNSNQKDFGRLRSPSPSNWDQPNENKSSEIVDLVHRSEKACTTKSPVRRKPKFWSILDTLEQS